MINKNEIGVTETYDPCFDFNWINNIRPVNIIITKGLTDKLINELLSPDCMKSCILHLTVTGWGGTHLEPHVNTYEWSKSQFDKLINMGFNSNNIVLRLDPIVPTYEGLMRANSVLEIFNNSSISRVRVSVLDMYSHVVNRFRDASIDIPYSTFQAPDYMMKNTDNLLKFWTNRYNFESCAEPKLTIPEKVGCVSYKDIQLIKNDFVSIIGSSKQRSNCLCPSNKVNIMGIKPRRCPHGCLYCYWKY